ncbi:MAG: MipA/OmpV family protein [Pseudomonadota bacterium]
MPSPRPRPRPRSRLPLRALPLLLLLLPLAARATSDVLIDLLAIPGSAGLGAIQRSTYTPYKGAHVGYDLVPVYMYEGKRVFLHATRIGIKLSNETGYGFDTFLDYRYEGHPFEQPPAILDGMARRKPTVDYGLGYRARAPWGSVDAEVLHDANNTSHGTETRLGYNVDWASGRFHLRPSVKVSHRSANLNNYYYGVPLAEASAARPAYMPGAGTDWALGLYAYYEMTQRWRLLGGIDVNFIDSHVRHSPIVEDKAQPTVLVGAAYDFGSHKAYSEPGLPLHLKIYGGRATECNFLPVVSLRCGSTRSEDDTRIWGFDLGRPLVERVNNWPLDFVAYAGLLRHDERGVQPDAWQLNASIKAYYYGFPWSARVRTRIGMAAGFALAQRVPLTEERDQARRGRETSKLLNYLDPSLDVSVGDLLGVKKLKESYLGIGVSHRSGIFGYSQLLGNINGGSNYLYTYLETKL